MKNQLLFSLLLSIFIFSCNQYPYNKIISEKDSFKKTERFHITFNKFAHHLNTNFGVIFPRKKVLVRFEKFYGNDSISPILMTLSSTITPYESLEENMFIKTKSSKEKYKFNSIDYVLVDKNPALNPHIDSVSTKDLKKAAIGAYVYKKLKAKLEIPIELKNEIINSNVIELRFYITDKPFSIDIKNDELIQLKKFMSSLGEK